MNDHLVNVTREGFRRPTPETWPPGLALKQSEYHTQDYQVLVVDHQTLIWRNHLPEGVSAIIKLYHHRGPISWIREHLFQFRVEREFLALTHLHKNGISCSKPLFWSKGSLPHYGGRFEVLATEEIPNAVSLFDHLNTNAVDKGIKLLLEECGLLVRNMHSCGVYHGAMYSRNILLGGNDREKPQAFIIDTPKAVVYPFDLVGTNLAKIDLMNLCRTLIDHGAVQSMAWVLDGYGLHGHPRTVLIEQLQNFRPTRHTRNLHRAYSGLIKFGLIRLNTRKLSV